MPGPESFPNEEPVNPGSLINFVAERGLDSRSTEALQQYSEAGERFREELAAYRGITLEQLHDGLLSVEQDAPDNPPQAEAA